MLNGAGGEMLAQLGAVAVAAVTSLLVYRDADSHGHYHALSASAAVAIAGLVGFAVGRLVGLFVGTGYVLLLYLLSYPTTPTVDPEPDGRPRGDAGETLAGDDDVVSVIRVEIAGHETLKQLARRYDDVPDSGTEAELRSALRVKALSHVREEIDGETCDAGGIGNWSEPREPTGGSIEEWSAAMPPAETDVDHGVAAWSAEEPPAESDGEFGAGEWSAETPPAESAVNFDAADWTEEADDPNERVGDYGGMVFDTAVEPPAERSGEDGSADDDGTVEGPANEQRADGDPFDGRGELYDGDETAPSSSQT